MYGTVASRGGGGGWGGIKKSGLVRKQHLCEIKRVVLVCVLDRYLSVKRAARNREGSKFRGVRKERFASLFILLFYSIIN